MALFSANHYHRNYVWVPVFTAFIWLSTLVSMLITWFATGQPHYVSMDGSIPYISDIGADILKPLFVVGCSITGVGFFLCLVIERWLRHEGRLVPAMRRREGVFAALAILGSFIGGVGLICLSVFDTKRYTSLHRVFLLVFILGVSISAIFSVVEYKWLSRDYEDAQKLRYAYIAKAILATSLIVLAVAFAIGMYTDVNVGAVFEWVIAIGYTLYLLTFWYDLRLSKGVSKGALRREMREVNESAEFGTSTPW